MDFRKDINLSTFYNIIKNLESPERDHLSFDEIFGFDKIKYAGFNKINMETIYIDCVLATKCVKSYFGKDQDCSYEKFYASSVGNNENILSNVYCFKQGQSVMVKIDINGIKRSASFFKLNGNQLESNELKLIGSTKK